MKTIFKIAWRNLWRNKLRTAVILMSIILGLWGSIFFMGLMNGMNESRISSAIDTYLAHVQIHDAAYFDNPAIENTVKDIAIIRKKIAADSRIQSVSYRSIVDAMATSSHGSQGVQLIGIQPEEDKKVVTIPYKLIAGTYLTKFKKPSVVIGEKLAGKLGVKRNAKLKFSFQNKAGDVLSYAFRVEGIYKLNNSVIEQHQVFIKQSDLKKILGIKGDFIHEILIKLNQISLVKDTKKSLQSLTKQDEVQAWDDVAPELGYAQEMMATFAYIFLSIILIALSFAIVNTMLMAVLERKREIGIMMAVGFNKSKMFAMIMLETLLIALIATPIGLWLSYISIRYFGKHGLEFISVSKGMEYFGIGARIFTKLDASFYWTIMLMTLIITFLSALIPARKALKTNPIESIREV